jgi:hypothetical protein
MDNLHKELGAHSGRGHVHRIGDGVDHEVPEEQVDGVLPRKPVAVARANKQTNKQT